MTFRLTMLPALDGDCLLVSWGSSSTLHHLIVDLGRGETFKAVKGELAGLTNVELFVMSHIDADHIAGAIPMVRLTAAPFNPQRVWYNGHHQLVAARDRQHSLEPFGAVQAEKLSHGIRKFGWPWNAAFESEVVSTNSPEASRPISLSDGLTVRLLSPTDAGLAKLLPVWDQELAKAHIRPFDPDQEEPAVEAPEFERFGAPNVQKLADAAYQRDSTEPNGASIAMVVEFQHKRVLLAADAHSEVLEAALQPLAQAEGGRYRIDLAKLAHHGSKANTSKLFPALLDCQNFAISTNGSRHNHPDAETIARLLAADKTRPKTLYFNYRQPDAEVWESPALEATWKYHCVFPVDDENDTGNGRLVIDV